MMHRLAATLCGSMFQQIIHTPGYPRVAAPLLSLNSHKQLLKELPHWPQGLSPPLPSHTRYRGMFYRCITFKHTKIRMLLLSLTPILAFYDPVAANVIEIEHSKRTSNTVCITTHKRRYQSLELTFFPLIKCLINEPHPRAWGLKDYWLKSMQCQVLLVNNMPRDSILRTFLIAL